MEGRLGGDDGGVMGDSSVGKQIIERYLLDYEHVALCCVISCLSHV